MDSAGAFLNTSFRIHIDLIAVYPANTDFAAVSLAGIIMRLCHRWL